MALINVQKSLSVTLVLLLGLNTLPLSAATDDETAPQETSATGPMARRQDVDTSKTLKVDGSADAKPADPLVQLKRAAAASILENVIPVSPDQTIQSGDSLYFSVSPAEELSRDILVDQNGKISIPLIGAIQAAGLTTDELSKKIVHALSRYVSHPKVDIFLKQSLSKQIGIAGQVTTPGSYPYRTNLHLLDAISLAGGFIPSANRKQVRIMRRQGIDRRVIPVNVEDIMASGKADKDVQLEPGDLIEVPRGVTGVSVFGSVVSPGVYEYLYDMRILDLVSLCHGFTDGAKIKHIKVVRGEAPNQKTMIVSFDDVIGNKPAANLALQPGDIVYVPQRSLWQASGVANVIAPIATLFLAAATIWLAAKK